MITVQKYVKNSLQKNPSLDTLAQLPPPNDNKVLTKTIKRLDLQKRARSKYFSTSLSLKLVDVKESPLLKSYWNSFHCAESLQQKAGELNGKYCKNRWCLTCNRIRTAKMTNGYSEALNEIARPYLVTLTVPNVKDKLLRGKVLEMQTSIRAIKKKLNKMGVNITGIRKLECTHNEQKNDYHPHFHFLISGKVHAMLLVNEWLNEFKDANRKGQDYRKADAGAVREIFKYFTKLVTKAYDNRTKKATQKHINIKAIDTIFQAIRRVRIYQPMGIVKKQGAYTKFIERIKSTYKPLKGAFNMPIQDDEAIKINAIFTATMQVNEKQSDYFVRNPKPNVQFNFFETYNEQPIPENEKQLCYEIKFTGVNMPEPFNGKDYGIRTFYKNEAVKWFENFYTSLNGININEEIEELFTQKVTGLPDGDTWWLWHGNDWFDIATGELLTEYNPNEAMRKICETIIPYEESNKKEIKNLSNFKNLNFFKERNTLISGNLYEYQE